MKNLITYSLLIISNICFCQTKLPSVFGDHMVLQQKSNVTIWGWDDPETTIKVNGSWKEKVKTITSKDGKWKVTIPTPSAGGPYEIKIQGSETIVFKNILIGEVWVCSGQSNMEMPLKGFYNQPVTSSQEAILNAKNNNIRLLKLNKNVSLNPIDTIIGSWKECTSASAEEFSAVAYFFGKQLEKQLNVPIGLIFTSWGGSTAEAWTNKKTLSNNFPTINLPSQQISKKDRGIQRAPTVLYNAMIHPLIPYNIKGIIWYQGESNNERAEEYKKLFPTMVKSWREEWQLGDFPFYFVQIAPWKYNGPDSTNGALLREAQFYASQTIKNSGMAVTLDIGDCKYIHPPEKKLVGKRLSYLALNQTYGIEGISPSGPIYKSMEIIEGKINIKFSQINNGLIAFDKELDGFKIAGKDKIFHKAKAIVLRGNKGILVYSDKVPKPIAVRYAFENCSEATLFNTEGLPASSFRTDDW